MLGWVGLDRIGLGTEVTLHGICSANDAQYVNKEDTKTKNKKQKTKNKRTHGKRADKDTRIINECMNKL